eukprot:g43359.t1
MEEEEDEMHLIHPRDLKLFPLHCVVVWRPCDPPASGGVLSGFFSSDSSQTMHVLIVISIQGRSRIMEMALDVPSSLDMERKDVDSSEPTSPLLDLLFAFSLFLPIGDHDGPSTSAASRFLEAAMSAQQSTPASPASKAALAALPRKVLTGREEASQMCTICQDALSEESSDSDSKTDRLVELPCTHVYHEHCLTSWLSVRNTCPVCRYKLPLAVSEHDRIVAPSDTSVTVEEQPPEHKSAFEAALRSADSSSSVIPTSSSPPSLLPPAVRTRRSSRFLFRSERSSSTSSDVALTHPAAPRTGWWKKFRPSCFSPSAVLD